MGLMNTMVLLLIKILSSMHDDAEEREGKKKREQDDDLAPYSLPCPRYYSLLLLRGYKTLKLVVHFLARVRRIGSGRDTWRDQGNTIVLLSLRSVVR